MDSSNLRNLMTAKPIGSKSQVMLIRDFDDQGKGEDIPDPYYLENQGFEQAYQILQRSTQTLLKHISDTHNL